MPELTKVQTGLIEPQGAFPIDTGTAAAPGLKFSDSAATGIFSPSTGVFGISTGSTQQALTILADGKVGIGNTNPSYKLDVLGDVNIDGNFTITQTTTISGLSADKLDGFDSSQFLRSDTSNDFTGVLQGNSPGGTYLNLRGGGSNDTLLLRVSAADLNEDISSNLSSDYGFNIRYRGDLNGVENALQIDADNQVGTAIEALRIKQDGVVHFGLTPQVGSNAIYHAGNLSPLTTSTTFGGDVSGTYNAIVVANDSHTHDTRYYTETESDARYLGITAKAADADLLDGIDSTGFLQNFYETQINSPNATSGTWTTATSSSWGDPKFNNVYDQNRYADGSAYVQYNIPSGYKSCWISQLQWSSGGYADCYGVQSDGGLVFLRRINTRQAVENTNEGNPDQHDGSTITHIGSGLDHFTAIRIQNRVGRIHLTGIAWTKNDNAGYEGTGMVHPTQISHQGDGSGLDADTVDGVEAEKFLRSDQNDTASGVITLSGSGSDRLYLRNTTNAGEVGIRFSDISNETQNGYFRFRHSDGTSPGSSYGVNFQFSTDQSNLAVIIDGSGDYFVGTNKVWHEGNQGDGSGLDADLLDGVSWGNVNTNILPASDNTGVIGNSSHTWNNGQFTNLTIDSTLNVRAAIDLADNDILRFGSGDDAELFCDGSHFYLDLNSGIGNFYIRDGTTTRFTFDDAGDFTATGNINSNSDIKLKTNIKTISNPLDKVIKLRGVEYNRIDMNNERQIGVIAQEVEKIIPELVGCNEGTKTVSYGNITAILIEAIKEQQKQIEELKSEIEGWNNK